MTMKYSSVNELELFIAEAKRLTTKSFYQCFHSGEEIGFSSESLPENMPTVEQLESYLLHFRKFIQKNDRIYFCLVNQYVNELAGNQTDFINEWNEVYESFGELMEAKALTGRVITYVADIPDLSLLDLFRARTFGDLSHLDPKKRLLHQKLSSTGELEALYRFEYYTLLSDAGDIIAEMANLCVTLLQSLSVSNSETA
jgi:hypothetical protein